MMREQQTRGVELASSADPHAQAYTGLRVLAIHAHPDDEALWTGGFISHLARGGADVAVVTCTLGEQGEVIGETFANLVADHADQLGGFRIRELQESLAILGARGIFLGAPGMWRDSGMVGDPSASHPRAFVNNLDHATQQLRAIVDQIRPHLILTYGPDGGYGHPDHIAAHRITHAVAPDDACILWAVTSADDIALASARTTSIPDGWRRPEPGEIACVDRVDVRVPLDDADYAAKRDAMKAHATQLWIADGSTSVTNPRAAFAEADDVVFALSNLIAQPLTRSECYQHGAGPELQRVIARLAGSDWLC